AGEGGEGEAQGGHGAIGGGGRASVVERPPRGQRNVARHDFWPVWHRTGSATLAASNGEKETTMRARHLLLLAGLLLASAAQAADTDAWKLPIATKTLDNGLTVVVSEDHSAPVVGVSVVYHVGMRLEPRDRTGFAHLFEHLMFEGTPNAKEGVFDRVISGGGGRNNGSTRPDFTNYIETAPVSALEPILWLEADRMKTLDFNPVTQKSQQDVVKEEIRVNVKNQPYGGFMWIDIGQQAFQKWENNHDGYGSFEDLETASLEDVAAFHRDYYGPNNA